jgi:hypothetical protein
MSDVTTLVSPFSAWLDDALSRRMPEDVRAFNFNLYEGERSWDVELVGTATFDPGNPSWACNAIYSYPELFFMPHDSVGLQWEQGLAAAIELITIYLRGGRHRDVLRSGVAVGVGFVDGDLTILWPETAA